MKAITISIMILALIAGCSSAKQANTGGKGRNAAQRAVPVEVKPAAMQDFGLTFTLSGRLEANQQVDVTSKASGKITKLFVHVGDQIQAGQPIAQLDGDDIQIQLQRSKASLLSAQAKYEDAKKGTEAEDLAQARNSLADMQNKYDSAKKDYERSQTLYREGAISESEVEKAKLALTSAATNLENQKQKLKLDQKGPTQTTLTQAQAQVLQAQADLALSQLNASNLVIKAPISGVIGSLPVTIGDTVNSSKVVAQIVDITTMKVQTQVDESKVGLFRNGQSVDIQVPSVHLKSKGTIISVSPLADATKSYPIEISTTNPDNRLKVGMIASVGLQGDQRKALVVPREAVVFKDQHYYVYTIENEEAKQVQVEVGESNGEQIEITKGLKQGDPVIVKGQNMLVPGAKVVVIDPNKPNQADQQSTNQQRRTRSANQPGQDQPAQKE